MSVDKHFRFTEEDDKLLQQLREGRTEIETIRQALRYMYNDKSQFLIQLKEIKDALDKLSKIEPINIDISQLYSTFEKLPTLANQKDLSTLYLKLDEIKNTIATIQESKIDLSALYVKLDEIITTMANKEPTFIDLSKIDKIKESIDDLKKDSNKNFGNIFNTLMDDKSEYIFYLRLLSLLLSLIFVVLVFFAYKSIHESNATQPMQYQYQQ